MNAIRPPFADGEIVTEVTISTPATIDGASLKTAEGWHTCTFIEPITVSAGARIVLYFERGSLKTGVLP